MTGADQNHADDELDVALRRLPQWQPPVDFAARLAAAAARQHEARDPLSPGLRRAGVVLSRATELSVLTLMSVCFATALAIAPWQLALEHSAWFAGVAVAAVLALGLPMSYRLLRS
jgi:hypothetical protein